MFATVFKLPSKTDLDWPLVLGELIFGVGWGLAGLCPGPVVAVLSVPAVGTIFLPSLWLGMKTVALLNDSTNNSLISASTKTPAAADANQVEVSTALNKSDAYSA